MASLEDIYFIVNSAIDTAFSQEKYQLNFYEYLQGENFKKDQIVSFINSSLGTAIIHQIEELAFDIAPGLARFTGRSRLDPTGVMKPLERSDAAAPPLPPPAPSVVEASVSSARS